MLNLTDKQKFLIRLMPYIFLIVFICTYFVIVPAYYQHEYIFYYPCHGLILRSNCDRIRNILNRSKLCRPWINDEKGIMTDYCYCNNSSWVELNIETVKKPSTLEVVACADQAGDDGTEGKIILDGSRIYNIFIPSKNCTTKEISLNTSIEIHTLRMEASKYGICDHEWVVWKSIRLI